MEKTRLDKLTLAQITERRLWKFVPSPKADSVAYVAADAARRPVSLKDRLVATEVRLADGTSVWALLENVDVTLPEFTKHWLVAHFRVDSKWWRLARYHDVDADRRSPQMLADKLGKPLGDVFPIRYDIQDACATASEALAGTIDAEPEVRLKRSEIIRMAVPKRTPASS
jgi:hypothetical protein